MGSTVLFTHLKIILLQCFQFSVLATISSIQTDPKSKDLRMRYNIYGLEVELTHQK